MRHPHRIAAASLVLLVVGAASYRADAQELPWDAPVAAISRAGTHIATIGEDGTIRVWTAEGNSPEIEFDGPERTRSLAFVAGGKRLVVEQSGGFADPGGVHLHDVATGERLHTWEDAESRRPMQGRVRLAGVLPAHDAIHLTYLGMHNESVSVTTFEKVEALDNLSSAAWVQPVGDGSSVLMPPPEGVGAVALVEVESLEIAWRRGNARGFEEMTKLGLGIGSSLQKIRPAEGADCAIADIEARRSGSISIAFELKAGKPLWVLETGRVIAIPTGESPRLIARLAAHHAVIDGRTGKTLRMLDEIPHDHGVLLAPDGKSAFGIDPATGDVKRVALDD